MTVEATQIDPAEAVAVRASGTIHPVWLRITHWINAVAMVMMIGSGWEIYNASPLFPFDFPKPSRSEVGSPARCSGISPPCGCSWSMASSMSRSGF